MQAVGWSLPPGAFAVQLRDKRRALSSLRIFAWRLRLATRSAGAALYVNGSAIVARDVGADGIHLGSGAGSVNQARRAIGRRTWVSVAAHDDDVRDAKESGANAVLVSPVFRRALPEKRGPSELADSRRFGLHAPAPGEVSSSMHWAESQRKQPEHVPRPVRTGVAVIRALLTSSRPGVAARTIDDAFARR